MRRRALVVLAAAALAPLAARPAAGAGEVVLSFRDAPGGTASGFRIERRAAGAEAFEVLALVGPGVAEFVDRDVRPGRLLCYRVRPLTSRSERDWSSEVCARAKDIGPSRASAARPASGAPDEPGPRAELAEAPAEPGPTPAPITVEVRPADGSATEPGAVASAPPEGARRVRAGGGWLQVLE